MKKLFYLPLAFFLFISCSKDSNNGGDSSTPKTETPDPESLDNDFYEIIITGEINRTISKTASVDGPGHRVYSSWVSGKIWDISFSDDLIHPFIETYRLEFSANREKMSSPLGIEVFEEETTYRVVNEKILFDDNDPSFSVFYTDEESGLVFGGETPDQEGAGKSEGTITMSFKKINDEYEYFSGSFEVEAFLETDYSKSIIIKGSWGVHWEL